jgi:peptidoglycan/LPS O-acetylase OafA/YrhL
VDAYRPRPAESLTLLPPRRSTRLVLGDSGSRSYARLAPDRLKPCEAPSILRVLLIGKVESQTRIPVLDGLRGTAILLVLLCHFTIYGIDRPAGGASLLLYRAAQSGWIGVDLFFVLSGFLITGILYRAKGQHHFFLNFYARRTLRIFPLYFGFLMLAVGVLPMLLPDNERLAGWVRESPWYWTYTSNVQTALHGWSPRAARGLDHFWSLAVEEQFYLLWPLAVFSLDRQQLIRVCAAAATLSLAVRMLLVSDGNPIAAYVLMPARMDALSAGAFVALVLQGPTPRVQVTRYSRVALAAFAAALCVLISVRRSSDPEDALVATFGYCCLAGFFASLLAGLVTSAHLNAGRLLESRFMRALGKYSYGLYVFHHPLLYLLPPAQLSVALHTYIDSDALARIAAILGVLAVCGAAAVASWHLFEQPILRMKDRFEQPAGATRAAIGSVAL